MVAANPPSLLTLPSELRNAIYLYLFALDGLSATVQDPPAPSHKPDPLAEALQIPQPTTFGRSDKFEVQPDNQRTRRALSVLQTCKQIHREAHLLALAHLPFHLQSDCSQPEHFELRARRLPRTKLAGVRTLTLTARISHLRALNEAWAGVPFGNADLRLDALIIVPYRPPVMTGGLQELADSSQCSTLAYVLGETMKGLRNVGYIEVRNHGCFNGPVWERVYLSVLYRLWRWGGGKCGIRFATGMWEDEGQDVEENRWFRAYLSERDGGADVGVEVCRIIGKGSDFPFDPTSPVGF